MKKLLMTLALSQGLLCFCLAQPLEKPSRNASIESLIQQMTLEEKVGQLNFLVGETIVTGPTMYTAHSEKFDELIRAGKITGLFNVYGAAYTGRLQKIAMEHSRLKIPLLFGADVIHGFKTVTPISLGEAASWNLDAIEASARMAAREATAAGINWNFAPMVDISRDPRWGRVSEGAGEDPYLGSLIGQARVRGFQGDDLSSPNTLAACVKHFAAYGAAEGGRDYNTTDVSERLLKEIYFPPYKAAIDAGAATVMTSFNELDGIPATANKKLIRDILQDQWNFRGLIVSDYGSISEILNHGVAAHGAEAAKLALEAGTDMDMMSYLFTTQLPKLIRENKVDPKLVDDAVRRVLQLKDDLGLFDNPYLYSDSVREKREIRSAENLKVARDMARRSFVLLKNDKNTLPLQQKVKSIAVIGPLADNKAEMNGSWSFFGEVNHPVTILEGIKSRVGKDVKITHHEGCNLYDDQKTKFKQAVKIAAQSEVIIAVVGESAVMNGEGASRSDLNLPGVQEELVRELVATGRPVVVVLINGRPLTIPWLEQNCTAILEAWTPGSEAGNAVADVLFGDYNPSGKLPMSFPRNVGQIPVYYNHKNTGRPYKGNYGEPKDQRIYQSRYRDVENSPLYPFGFGLSYSRFTYSDIVLNKSSMSNQDSLTATITLTNTGKYDGEEVVQLYLRDLVASVARPVKELKGFKNVFLKSGESRQVSFAVKESDLRFYRADMTFGSEPGKFEIYIGGNSRDVKTASFELTDMIDKIGLGN